jgi:hypothetical protein
MATLQQQELHKSQFSLPSTMEPLFFKPYNSITFTNLSTTTIFFNSYAIIIIIIIVSLSLSQDQQQQHC